MSEEVDGVVSASSPSEVVVITISGKTSKANIQKLADDVKAKAQQYGLTVKVIKGAVKK